MLSATGAYRLDPTSARFFGARIVRLIHREESALGRIGRFGTLHGTLRKSVLRAEWKQPLRRGWVILRFDEAFTSFEGDYGFEGWDSEPVGTCLGQVCRR